MSILDNELVRKYFSPEYKAYYPVMDKTSQMDAAAWDRAAVALSILKAMEADMEMYEKGIYTHDEGKTWKEGDITGVPFKNEFHPTWLRLPDQFQASQKKHYHPEICCCPNCRETCKQKSDQVDEKIEDILSYYGLQGSPIEEAKLRELVELARKEK